MGGSYDPVHEGHLSVAEYVCRAASLDEVWMSLSPMSPFKIDAHPVSDADRFEMLRLAVAEYPILKAINRELTLPRPSYTITLLDTLCAENPHTEFVLIIGGDNWESFDRWHRASDILDRYKIIVYPRPGSEVVDRNMENVTIVDAPRMSVSSTEVRDALRTGVDVNNKLPSSVLDYIKTHRLYE